MIGNTVFDTVKKNILDVLPDIDPKQISIDHTLVDLGANSIDRVDILTQTFEDLGVSLAPDELGTINNLQGLVSLLETKVSGSKPA